uniref:THUMP domain-containing protein n=1 Tax=Neospora caninum (strain Liverpool) TaxID=572307 RepID=A0A0F7UCH2_NEOCL|nr:TPA: hypothetical protein BN1204_033430 [Neospora caninum Liverpool]
MKRQGGPFPPARRGGGRGGRGEGVSFSEKRRRLNVDTSGCKGVFLTTNTGERQAFLPENDSRKPETHAERGAADEVTEALASELASLREGQKRFVPMKDLLKGAIFIQFTREEDVPSVLLHGLMERVLAQPGVFSCRHISRMVPVDVTAPPTLEGLLSIARPLVAKTMPHSRASERVDSGENAKALSSGETPSGEKSTEKEGTADGGDRKAATQKAAGEAASNDREEGKTAAEGGDRCAEPEASTRKNTEGREQSGGSAEGASEAKEGQPTGKDQATGDNAEPTKTVSTWSCQYTSRSFDTVKKQAVLDLLADEVGPAYKVNIRESEFSIVVECNPIFCGVSIVRDYGKFFRYNLHRCCHSDQEKDTQSSRSDPPREELDSSSDAQNAAPSGSLDSAHAVAGPEAFEGPGAAGEQKN